jgi:hypothetical protein
MLMLMLQSPATAVRLLSLGPTLFLLFVYCYISVVLKGMSWTLAPARGWSSGSWRLQLAPASAIA